MERPPPLTMVCDIEKREKTYHPSQLTRFRSRVSSERLEGIVDGLVETLIESGIIRGEIVTMVRLLSPSEAVERYVE